MIVVFGASGRTGQPLLRFLATRQRRTCAVVRPGTEWPHLSSPHLRLLQADLRQRPGLSALVRDAEHAVYLAGPGLSFLHGLWSRQLDEHLVAFKNCLDAALKAKLPGRFVFVSPLSIEAMDSWLGPLGGRSRERWFEHQRQCEAMLLRSTLNYLVVRVTGLIDAEPRQHCYQFVDQVNSRSVKTAAPIPREALAALIGQSLSTPPPPRLRATVISNPEGSPFVDAVENLQFYLEELSPQTRDVVPGTTRLPTTFMR